MRFKDTGATVDPRHEAAVSEYSWCFSHGYLRHYRKVDGKVKNLFGLQELVWRLEHGVTVKHLDHINGDRLDNRIENLRPSTWSLQSLNSRRHINKRSGLPKGVQQAKQGRYQTAITYHGKTYQIGTFDTPDDASAAYERNRLALIEYEAAVARGEAPDKPVVLTGLGPRKRGRPRIPTPCDPRKQLGTLRPPNVTPDQPKHDDLIAEFLRFMDSRPNASDRLDHPEADKSPALSIEPDSVSPTLVSDVTLLSAGGTHASSKTQDYVPNARHGLPADPQKPVLCTTAAQELFDERAAIMHFDGGLTEASAESSALAELIRLYTLDHLPR